MRRIAACLLAAALAPGLRAAPADEADVRRLDAEYVRAYLASDAAAFGRLLADDFVCVLADGRMLDRAAFLAMAAQPPPVSGFHTGEIRVQLHGDAAVVSGRAEYRRKDGSAAASRYLEVYVRQDGRWRLAAAQFSRLAP